jgi:hypothetical protein
MRNAYKFLGGNLNGRGYFRDLGVEWEIIIIKADLGDRGCVDVDWIHLAQYSLMVGFCKHESKTLHFIRSRKFLD